MDDYSDENLAPWQEFSRDIKLIWIEDGVTSIGSWAFNGAMGLTGIDLPGSLYSIGNHAFLNCMSLPSITIPDRVTIVGAYAFQYCSSLTSVQLSSESNLAEISEGMFEGCSKLTGVRVPGKVESIRKRAFLRCSSLGELTIEGTRLRTIEELAFGENGLTSIKTIPASVTKIAADAFRDCYTLNDIYTRCTKSQWGALFGADYNTLLATIHCADGMLYTNSKMGFVLGVDTPPFRNSPASVYWSDKYRILPSYYNFLKENKSPTEWFMLRLALESPHPLHGGWEFDTNNGMCYGMSTVMQQFYLGNLDPDYFDRSLKHDDTVHDMSYPKRNYTVESLFAYYQAVQKTPEYLRHEKEWLSRGQKAMMREMISQLQEGVPVVVNFQFGGGPVPCKHAVLAYQVIQEDDKSYTVSIADPSRLVGPNQETESGGAGGSAGLVTMEVTPQYEMSSITAIGSQLPYSTKFKMLSLLTPDDGVLSRYNLQRKLTGGRSRMSESMALAAEDPLVILRTNYSAFTITSADRSLSATVSGDNITGTGAGDIIGPVADSENGESFVFYLPDTGEYTITPVGDVPEGGYQTAFYYDDGTEGGSCVTFQSAAALPHIFHPNGKVEVSGNTGSEDFLVTTTTNNTTTPWHTVMASSSVSQLSVTPSAAATTIESNAALGALNVSGADDWIIYALPTVNTSETSVSVVEEDQGDSPYIAIQDGSGEILETREVGYTVFFEAENVGEIAPQANVPYGGKVSAPQTPANSGYRIEGWYKDYDCSAGQKWNFAEDTVTENIILYAKCVESSNVPDVPSEPSAPSEPGVSGGSSSSRRSSTKKSSPDENSSYDISAPSDVSGGNVTIQPASASEGSKVTITAIPDSGYEVGSVAVIDKDGKEITVTDINGGKFTFVMPKSKVDVKVEFVRQQTVPSFTDIQPGAYYADAVTWAVKEGITTGTSATTFSPDNPCTRAQIVTFLWQAAGSPKVNASNSFIDVPVDSYYYDAVAWAVSQGITSGTSDTMFSPDAACIRAQAVTFLYRASGSPAVSGNGAFADVASEAYYSDAVQWAVNKNIAAGTSATTFSPNATCTRGQIVTFLYRDMA